MCGCPLVCKKISNGFEHVIGCDHVSGLRTLLKTSPLRCFADSIRSRGDGGIPDARTIWLFREQLTKARAVDALCKPMPEPRQRANAARSVPRCAIEHVFADQKHRMGLFAPSMKDALATLEARKATLVAETNEDPGDTAAASEPRRDLTAEGCGPLPGAQRRRSPDGSSGGRSKGGA